MASVPLDLVKDVLDLAIHGSRCVHIIACWEGDKGQGNQQPPCAVTCHHIYIQGFKVLFQKQGQRFWSQVYWILNMINWL